ncbi:MAG: nitrate/nitrite transporter NarK [Bradymonadia bacterium]|jgi:nitrate/nitrite transporter NarK
MQDQKQPQRILFMLALVVAGEAIFGLPFVVARVFRPTLLEVLDISNTQLGTAFSIYGVVAMVAYFPGGPLADRFPARKLMTAALLSTALGGIIYASTPSFATLKLLFGFWGCTTILLFWAAMIRATREWGGDDSQGKAFGILDGGRGLFAAVLATLTVVLFGALMPENPDTATLAQKAGALSQVIWIFMGMTVLAGVLVWFFVPENTKTNTAARHPSVTPAQVLTVVRNPAVWLQALIVVTAYTGYKGIDGLGLYAQDVFGFDQVQAAQVGTLAFWVRPFAAFGAGALGDRFGGAKTIVACFGVMIIGDLVIATGMLQPSIPVTLFVTVVATSAAVYAVRGLYFALFGEAQVPAALTGTAAGLVSVVGYTPDIFMGPLMGYFLDNYEGATGHQYFFAAQAGFAAIGLVCTLGFVALAKRNAQRVTSATT